MLIFDGDCGFCTSVATWASANAVPWQTLDADALAALGLTVDDVRTAAWWIDGDGRRSRGSLAIAEALKARGGLASAAGRLLLVPPFRWLGIAAYPLIARWRHLLPGGTPACRM